MPQISEYEEWSPSSPDKLYIVDGFIDGDFTLIEGKLNWKILLQMLPFYRVLRRYTVYLRVDGAILHIGTLLTFENDLSFISRLITDYQIK